MVCVMKDGYPAQSLESVAASQARVDNTTRVELGHISRAARNKVVATKRSHDDTMIAVCFELGEDEHIQE